MAEGSGVGFQTSFGDITGALGDIFGTEAGTSGITSGTTTGTTKERLRLDEAAIEKIIQDTLAAGGLADIFAGEQVAGIFDSTVAAQAAGDLASRLVGELAKLTAEREVETEQETQQQQQQSQEAGGLLDPIFEGVAGVFGF